MIEIIFWGLVVLFTLLVVGSMIAYVVYYWKRILALIVAILVLGVFGKILFTFI